MVRWRFAVAGLAVLTTTVLVTAGQPGNGVGFGLVVGLLVNVPWMVFAAAAPAPRPAVKLTAGWLLVQAAAASVSWSLSGPIRPPAGDWLGPCVAIECIGLMAIGLMSDPNWMRRAPRWLAAAVPATVLAVCVGGCAQKVNTFMAEVGDGPIVRWHPAKAYYLPLPDGLTMREFEPSCTLADEGLCPLGYEVWDPAGGDRGATGQRLLDHLRRNGWPIPPGREFGCVDRRGILDWGEACVSVRTPESLKQPSFHDQSLMLVVR
jgi:hypothetical protein